MTFALFFPGFNGDQNTTQEISKYLKKKYGRNGYMIVPSLLSTYGYKESYGLTSFYKKLILNIRTRNTTTLKIYSHSLGILQLHDFLDIFILSDLALEKLDIEILSPLWYKYETPGDLFKNLIATVAKFPNNLLFEDSKYIFPLYTEANTKLIERIPFTKVVLDSDDRQDHRNNKFYKNRAYRKIYPNLKRIRNACISNRNLADFYNSEKFILMYKFMLSLYKSNENKKLPFLSRIYKTTLAYIYLFFVFVGFDKYSLERFSNYLLLIRNGNTSVSVVYKFLENDIWMSKEDITNVVAKINRNFKKTVYKRLKVATVYYVRSPHSAVSYLPELFLD